MNSLSCTVDTVELSFSSCGHCFINIVSCGGCINEQYATLKLCSTPVQNSPVTSKFASHLQSLEVWTGLYAFRHHNQQLTYWAVLFTQWKLHSSLVVLHLHCFSKISQASSLSFFQEFWSSNGYICIHFRFNLWTFLLSYQQFYQQWFLTINYASLQYDRHNDLRNTSK